MNLMNDSRRSCYVDEKKAIFHRWVDTSFPKDKGFILQTLALVEYENGSVQQVQPKKVRFADGGGFDQFAWRPRKGEEEDYI